MMTTNRIRKYLPQQNRLKKYWGESMTISDLMKKLKDAKGYQLCISILNDEGDKIEHSLITKKFPKVDMLGSLGEVRKLIYQNLEDMGMEGK